MHMCIYIYMHIIAARSALCALGFRLRAPGCSAFLCAVLCCALLCSAVLCCALLCSAVLCVM